MSKLLFICFAVVLFVAAVTCQPTGGIACSMTVNGNNVANFNACSGLQNTANAGDVYCLPTNIDAINNFNGQTGNVQPDYRCVPCMSNCDCGTNQYCQSNNLIESNYGTCQNFPNNLIGSACSSQAQAAVTIDPNNYVHVANLWCGVIGSYTVAGSSNATYSVVWQGSCVDQECQACDSTAIDDGCGGCYISICGGDQYSENGANVGTPGTQGQLWCIGNSYTRNSAGTLTSFLAPLLALF